MSDEPDYLSFTLEKSDRERALQTPTLVVVPELKSREVRLRDVEERLEEARGLAEAIKLDVRDSYALRISALKAATYFGTGQVDAMAKRVEELGISLVIIDTALSPAQQRNLEKLLKAKVLDRTGLILEIFGARASTREGTLQVALAHLSYQRSRLVRSWTHLERQRGGVGFLGGPGETQIETDRRLLQERIDRIKSALDDVKRTRTLHRKGREGVPVIALVGYTNAGKSTLFNILSGADVMAKDMLFATLDPTLRQFEMPLGRTVVLSDTVGFVSNLPTELVSAFAATLEEVVEADLILHVRDIASEDTEAQARDVETTLAKIGVAEDAPIFEVWNKIDKVADEDERAALIATASRIDSAPVVISALSGYGLEALTARIEAALSSSETLMDVLIPLTEGRMTSWFYQNATILSREDTEHGTKLRITIDNAGLSRALPFKV